MVNDINQIIDIKTMSHKCSLNYIDCFPANKYYLIDNARVLALCPLCKMGIINGKNHHAVEITLEQYEKYLIFN